MTELEYINVTNKQTHKKLKRKDVLMILLFMKKKLFYLN